MKEQAVNDKITAPEEPMRTVADELRYDYSSYTFQPTEPAVNTVTEAVIETVRKGLKEYSIDNFSETDMGQAEAAVHYINHLIKYVPEWGWLAFDTGSGSYRTDVGEPVLHNVLKILAKARKTSYVKKTGSLRILP